MLNIAWLEVAGVTKKLRSIMRATEFMHFINIDPKELKLGHNLKGDSYTHMTIRMKIKRARYEHQTRLREENKK